MTNPIRSLADRILALKGQQDAIGEDIRKVYAEASENSIDKTALGQLVQYIRKRDKDPLKAAELAARLDEYIAAYNAGMEIAPTRVRGKKSEELPHDPVTGELPPARPNTAAPPIPIEADFPDPPVALTRWRTAARGKHNAPVTVGGTSQV